MPDTNTQNPNQNLSTVEQALNWIGDKLLDVRNSVTVDLGTQRLIQGMNVVENYKVIYEKQNNGTNSEWSVKLASQGGAVIQAYTGATLNYAIDKLSRGLAEIYGEKTIADGIDFLIGGDSNGSLNAAYARVGESAGNATASGLIKVLSWGEELVGIDVKNNDRTILISTPSNSSTPNSVTINQTTNPSNGKSSVAVSSNDYTKEQLTESSKSLIKNEGSNLLGSSIKIEGNDGTINLTLQSSDNLSSLLTKYGLNANLSDFLSFIPSFSLDGLGSGGDIVNDGNGGNFNISALPNFSDLNGIERENAWHNFTNSFLSTALSPLEYNLDRFTSFLDSNRLTFSDFITETSDTLKLDSGNFSSSFNRYFVDAFQSNLRLDKDIFKTSVSIVDGKELINGKIVKSDENPQDLERPIQDPELKNIEGNFSFPSMNIRISSLETSILTTIIFLISINLSKI